MKDPAAADIVVSTEHTIDGRVVDVKRAVPRDMAPAPARYLLNKLTLFLFSLISSYGRWSTLASISIIRFPLRICCCMCVASSQLSVVQQCKCDIQNAIRLPLQLQLQSAKDLSMPFPISTSSFDFSWLVVRMYTSFLCSIKYQPSPSCLELHYRFSLLEATKHLSVAPAHEYYGSFRFSRHIILRYPSQTSSLYYAISFVRHCFSRAYLLVIVGSTRTRAAVDQSMEISQTDRQINRPRLLGNYHYYCYYCLSPSHP